MKKFLFFATFSLLTHTVFSQAGFHAGVNLAFNNAWIFNQNNYGITEMDYELKFGGLAGIEAGYNFTENMGAEAEVNFVMMGQNYFDRIRDFGPVDSITGKSPKVDTYRHIKLNYLQVPLLFRFQTTKEKKDKIELHAMLGPSVGILLSADQYYEADMDANGSVELVDASMSPEQNVIAFAATPEIEEPEKYFSSLDIGVHADIGVDIYLNKNIYITPALKLYMGFMDVNAEATRQDPIISTPANEYSMSRNGFAAISVGIHYINIKSKKK
ncbi:MAG: PorT family protein [Fimbriimonadaceae bacterium]|nr:PorT family protein [Chitinophagales bacterium]